MSLDAHTLRLMALDAMVPEMVNVRDHGAQGDGATDDTTAIRAAIAVAAGIVPVHVPAGVYMVDAVTGGVGLPLTVAGTILHLAPSAVIKVIPNAAVGYKLISVTAADCLIVGGTLLGDVRTHAGDEGQWGHLINIGAGGHRCTVSHVAVREAWGDGIAVVGGAKDAYLVDVIADSNRRQGVSLIGAVRPRIIGGSFRNTGKIRYHSPAAGIDVEPNPGSGFDVTGFEIRGVTCSDNAGWGLLIVKAQGQETSGDVSNIVVSGNGRDGFKVSKSDDMTGSRLRVTATGVATHHNAQCGIYLSTTGATVKSVTASGNSGVGVWMGSASTLDLAAVSRSGRAGIEVGLDAAGASITSARVSGNGQACDQYFQEISIYAGCSLSDVETWTDTIGRRCHTGIAIRTEADGVVARNCQVRGEPTSHPYSNQGQHTSIKPPIGARH